MCSEQQDKTKINETIIKQIAELVKKIQFGSILIKVHDSRISQVEVTEKSRFDNMWVIEKGGGI